MIRQTLQTHSSQTFHHFRQVGACMVKLGGVPVGSMLELVNQAYLEPEGAGSWPKMLAYDRVHGATARADVCDTFALISRRHS
jgi:hypothetical protein